jgi:hypothetical protein
VIAAAAAAAAAAAGAGWHLSPAGQTLLLCLQLSMLKERLHHSWPFLQQVPYHLHPVLLPQQLTHQQRWRLRLLLHLLLWQQRRLLLLPSAAELLPLGRHWLLMSRC